MSYYIVCQKKRNNPRMDIRICQKKCELKDECKDFLALYKMTHDADVILNIEAGPLQMEPA